MSFLIKKFETILVYAFIGFFTILTPLLFTTSDSWSPFENIKIYSSLILATVVVSFLCIIHFSKTIQLKINSMILALLVFLASMVLSGLFSVNIENSFWGTDLLPTGAIVPYIIVTLFTLILFSYEKLFTVPMIINAVLISGVAVACYGVVQHFGLDPVGWWGYKEFHIRAYSTLGNPIQFGMFVGTVSFLALINFFNAKKPASLFITLILWLITVMGTLLSGSRAPIILQAAALLGVLIILFFYRQKITFFKTKISLLIVFFVAAHSFNYYENKKNALADRIGQDAFVGGLGLRLAIWDVGIKSGFERPVIGFGPELFFYAYHKYRPSNHNLFQTWNESTTKAHNELVNLWVCQGLVGLLCFAFVVFVCFRQFWWIFKTEKNPDSRISFFLIFAAMGYLFLNNLFVFNLFPTLILTVLLPALFFLNQTNVKQFSISSDKRLFGQIIKTAIIVFSLGLGYQGWNFFIANEYFSSAVMNRALKNYKKSFELVQQSIIHNPTRSYFYCVLSDLLVAGRLSPQSSPLSIPSDSEFWVNYSNVTDHCTAGPSVYFHIWYQAGMSAGTLGNLFPESLERSMSHFKKGQELNPTYPLFPLQLAILSNRTKDFNQAIIYIDEAIALKPDFLEAHYVKLEILYKQKHQDAINKALEQLFAFDLKASVYKHRLYFLESIRDLASKNNDLQNEVKLYTYIYQQKKRGVD